MSQAQLVQSAQAGVPIAPDSFPRWILYFSAGIIAFSLISVGLIRITGNGPDQLAAAPTVQRSLVFEDQKDGGVRVADGVSGQTLTVLYGEQGFVRGAATSSPVAVSIPSLPSRNQSPCPHPLLARAFPSP